MRGGPVFEFLFGIETHFGHKMRGFQANQVMTEGGEFAADMILFMPGMTGNAWCDNTNLPRSEGGLIKANALGQALFRVDVPERISLNQA